jgi:hypothetical protein
MVVEKLRMNVDIAAIRDSLGSLPVYPSLAQNGLSLFDSCSDPEKRSPN